MDYFHDTKIQISPCIAAKAKFALNLSKKKPLNTKKCSQSYWNEVIQTFSIKNKISEKDIEKAKSQYQKLIN
jgi:hypothetical protein